MSPDNDIRFVDQTGYRIPSYPLYPLVRAVDLMAEEKGDPFDWSTVDFVTDRNGLRKLLRWMNDDGTAKEFRIDTQLAGGSTVLLNRWEKKTREGPNPRYSTYGFSFERESTYKAPGMEQAAATGYHRIVKYVSIFRFYAVENTWFKNLSGFRRSDIGRPLRM